MAICQNHCGRLLATQEKYYYQLPTNTEIQKYPASADYQLDCWSLRANNQTNKALRLARNKFLALGQFEVVTVNSQGETIKQEFGYVEYFKENLTDEIALEMVYVPGGQFMMGSPSGEGSNYEKPQHQVSVQSFFLGKNPITQAQYQAIMGKNPSHFSGQDRPVENVSWEDAVEFCRQLSIKTGKAYRLPTEAEWEYAARAGTTTPFHFGATITDKLANYNASTTYANETQGNYRAETTIVRIFPPNAFGLYDMHGNVWEWCEDNWHDNYKNAPSDGRAWLSGKSNRKVVRGGSWGGDPDLCRSAYRSYVSRDYRFNPFGFRVVCGAPRT